MALIHEKLYQSEDLAVIEFGEYARSLVADLFRSYQVNHLLVTTEVRVTDVGLTVEAAVPCGLIINELVSNAFKHGFPAGRPGKVCVDLHPETDDHILLKVSDDGVGFKEGVDFRQTASLGMQLVTTLTDQVSGTIELVSSGGGTEFQIRFPARRSPGKEE